MGVNANTTQANELGASTDGISLDDVIPFIDLIFGTLGLVGNGLVLVVMIRVQSLRTITNLFIINQSVIDFLTSVFLLAIIYNPRKIDFSSLPINVWSKILCFFWHSQYPFWTLLMCSTLNLMVLTLERYIAVVFPLVYRDRITWKSASVFAALPWVLGSIFQLYWPAAHHLINGACYPSYGNRTNQMLLGVLIFVVKLLIPVVTMFVVYYSILQKLRPKIGPDNRMQDTHDRPTVSENQHMGAAAVRADDHTPSAAATNNTVVTDDQPQGQRGSSVGRGIVAAHGNPSADSANVITAPADQHSVNQHTRDAAVTGNPRKDRLSRRIRVNVIKTLFIVTVVFALCWTPVQVLFLLYNLGVLNTHGIPYTSGTPYKLAVVIAFINIWINPVIYTFKYRRFQDGLRKTFGLRQKQDSTLSTS